MCSPEGREFCRRVVRGWGQGRTVKCPFLVLSYGGHAEYEMASGFAGFVCFTAAKAFLFLTPHLPYLRNTKQLGSMGGDSLSKDKLEMKGLELSRLAGSLDWNPQGLSDPGLGSFHPVRALLPSLCHLFLSCSPTLLHRPPLHRPGTF